VTTNDAPQPFVVLDRLHAHGLAVLFTTSLALCGCSGAGAFTPKPEPLPPDAKWSGVYQGPYHVQLRIETHGNQASGDWRAIGGRLGEFSGTVSGNLLVLDFSERALDNSEGWTGHGYFVYRAGAKGAPDEISGEWGLGQGAAKSPWWAIKRGGAELATEDFADNESADDDADSPSCTIGCDSQDTESE
jgi:hypothetical protein